MEFNERLAVFWKFTGALVGLLTLLFVVIGWSIGRTIMVVDKVNDAKDTVKSISNALEIHAQNQVIVVEHIDRRMDVLERLVIKAQPTQNILMPYDGEIER